MSKIINDMDIVDQAIFSNIKKQSSCLNIGRYVNLKTKLDIEKIQEIYEHKNDVYVTQHQVQYVIKKASLKQILLPLIDGKNLKIKFEFEKIRFFCSNCGGVGVIDWISSIKRLERFQKFSGKRKKNSKNFLVYEGYPADLIIKGTIPITKDDLHSINLCKKCNGSGIEPPPHEKLIDDGSLRQIYFKYLEKASD